MEALAVCRSVRSRCSGAAHRERVHCHRFPIQPPVRVELRRYERPEDVCERLSYHLATRATWRDRGLSGRIFTDHIRSWIDLEMVIPRCVCDLA